MGAQLIAPWVGGGGKRPLMYYVVVLQTIGRGLAPARTSIDIGHRRCYSETNPKRLSTVDWRRRPEETEVGQGASPRDA